VVPVELKLVKKGRKVSLSPHQVAFHMRHAEYGVRTFILVLYCPPKLSIVKHGQLLVYAGGQAIELVKSGVDTAPIASYAYSTVPWGMLMYTLAEA
jgi:hypothetical protein